VDIWKAHLMVHISHLVNCRSGQSTPVDSRKLMMAKIALLILVSVASASGQEYEDRVEAKNLSLEIYLQDTGQALVMGYVDAPLSLIFLRPAQYSHLDAAQYALRYRYENDTRQLYAWTDALTFKQGDIWRLMLSCPGFYDQYRVVFHLPGDLRLGRINSSAGVSYTVFASNDSLVVDAQANYARNPSISIEYQQPLANDALTDEAYWSDDQKDAILVAGAISALAAGLILASMVRVRRRAVPGCGGDGHDDPHSGARSLDGSRSIETAKPLAEASRSEAFEQEASSSECVSSKRISSACSEFVEVSEEGFDADEALLNSATPEAVKGNVDAGSLMASSELMAVLDTLTPRERSIMDLLIKHCGKMTQMEMRYETGMPKSSLTMSLISLEKRRLVTRKGSGRTNIIEISERLLSEKKT